MQSIKKDTPTRRTEQYKRSSVLCFEKRKGRGKGKQKVVEAGKTMF